MPERQLRPDREPERSSADPRRSREPSRRDAPRRASERTPGGLPRDLAESAGEVVQHDLSGVRLRADSSAASAMGARAFAQGNEIHLAPGEYRPNSGEGRRLLGHELAHVVQQARGRVPATRTVEGVRVNDDPALEREADRVGAQVEHRRSGEGLAEGRPESGAPVRLQPLPRAGSAVAQGAFVDGLKSLNASKVKLQLKAEHGLEVAYSDVRALELEEHGYRSLDEVAAALRESAEGPSADSAVADVQGRSAGAAGVTPRVDREVAEARPVASSSRARTSPVPKQGPSSKVGGASAAAAVDAMPSTVQKRRLAADTQDVFSLKKKISEGIQSKPAYSKLKFLDGTEAPAVRTVKINMALRSDASGEVIETLTGSKPASKILKLLLDEFRSMLPVDPSRVDEAAVDAFAHYTKEGYENVTGLARGGVRYDKAKKVDRAMRTDEIAKGEKTLQSLEANWPNMPKSKVSPLHRVVHKGRGIADLKPGATLEKPNPTSTSVAVDWTRIKPGKVWCEITVTNLGGDWDPVDTRAVSTYTHEGEILLPPRTVFRMDEFSSDGTKATLTATLPTTQPKADRAEPKGKGKDKAEEESKSDEE